MRATHRSDIFSFAVFDEARNLDFNGTFVVRTAGNVMIDPVPMSAHDLTHVRQLGGIATVIITNSDHVRDAMALAEQFGAAIAGPVAEREGFPIACTEWLGPGAWRDGIEIVELHGSKTPGELALLIDGDTLVVGDLIRGHVGGSLNLLPDAKLVDRAAALASVRALAARPAIKAVLVGDGWPLFRDGRASLRALVDAA